MQTPGRTLRPAGPPGLRDGQFPRWRLRGWSRPSRRAARRGLGCGSECLHCVAHRARFRWRPGACALRAEVLRTSPQACLTYRNLCGPLTALLGPPGKAAPVPGARRSEVRALSAPQPGRAFAGIIAQASPWGQERGPAESPRLEVANLEPVRMGEAHESQMEARRSSEPKTSVGWRGRCAHAAAAWDARGRWDARPGGVFPRPLRAAEKENASTPKAAWAQELRPDPSLRRLPATEPSSED